MHIFNRKHDWKSGVLRCEFNGFSLTDEDLIVFLSSLMLMLSTIVST